MKCIEKNKENNKNYISDINSNQNNNKNKKEIKLFKSSFKPLKIPDKLNINSIEKNEIKNSKTQKKSIMKVPKSLDIKRNENIVGLIEGKIKHILKEDFKEKITPTQKLSLKNFSSELSLIKSDDKKDVFFS